MASDLWSCGVTLHVLLVIDDEDAVAAQCVTDEWLKKVGEVEEAGCHFRQTEQG